MKTVAYLRVSTARQDASGQRLAILEYARRQGLRIDDFIEATASARTNAKHRRLDQLMAVLEPGDQLVVSELSRVGRSLGEVVALLDAIAKASVAFVAVKENIRFEGRQDLQTKVMTTLFALFAEVERDLIYERTREGSRKPGCQGRNWGDRRDRWAYRASTAGRTRSATCSSWACRRAPSRRSPASPAPRSTTSSPPEG